MRAFCPLVLWSICCAAGAQPVDPGLLRPLDQGNRWEYAVLSTGTDTDSVRSIEVFEVKGDTTRDGERLATLHGRRYDDRQREIERWTCDVRYDAASREIVWTEAYRCRALTPIYPIDANSAYVARGTSVTLGGHDYDVEAIIGYDTHAWGTGGSGGGASVRATRLFGVHQLTTYSRSHWAAGGGSSSTTWTLQFALIAGEHFGEPVLTDPAETDWTRFSPLHVGNDWLYSVENLALWTPAPGPYLSFKVEGDTTIAGLTYRVLTGKELDHDLLETQKYRWAFRLDAEGQTIDLVPMADSPEAYALPILSRAYSVRGVLQPSIEVIAFKDRQAIGTRIIDVEAVAVYRASLGEPENVRGEIVRDLIADVGVHTHRHREYGSMEDVPRWDARLEYAWIDGRTYGRLPGGDVTSGPLRISAAYPNPFDRHLQLEIETDDPQGLHAALFDMLGRKVAERELASSNLASVHFAEVGVAGAYLLVITDRHGRSASRRLIHLPGHGAR